MQTTSELLSGYDRRSVPASNDYQPVDSDEAKKRQVASIFNELFIQLQAAFPASMATIRDQNQLNEFRKQWMLAFLENGITTMDQVNAGMRHARKQDSPFIPSPGKFVAWCKDSKTVLGLDIDDVMTEFHRYAKERGMHAGGPERFPWRHKALYWIVCDTRRQMYQRQLSEAEVEKFAAKKLDEWARKVSAGEQIPDPVASIESKKEVFQTSHNTTSGDHEFRYMPNAAVLGSMTPAQWLHQEFLRRKQNGLI